MARIGKAARWPLTKHVLVKTVRPSAVVVAVAAVVATVVAAAVVATTVVVAAGGKLHANFLLTGTQFFWRNFARSSAFSCADVRANGVNCETLPTGAAESSCHRLPEHQDGDPNPFLGPIFAMFERQIPGHAGSIVSACHLLP